MQNETAPPHSLRPSLYLLLLAFYSIPLAALTPPPHTHTIHSHTTPGQQQSFAASTNVAAAAAAAAGVDVPDAWTQDPVGPGGGGGGAGRLLGRRVVQRGRVVLLAREGVEAGSDDTAVVEWDGGGETEVPVSLLCFD